MKVYCHDCGLELESDIGTDELLAQEKQRDPSIGSIQWMCQTCRDVFIAANPNVPVVTDASD